jgi:polyisoprenoid-binding protein YceI
MKVNNLMLLMIFWVLSTGVTSGDAQPGELCAPFRGGAVAPEKVQTMLSAADDGHLYRILPSTSRVGFCIDSEVSRFSAEFRSFQGGLSLWPDSGAEEQVLVVIQADSLDADSAIVERMLKSTHFFAVDQYPLILFSSTGIHWMGSSEAVLTGDLTLHGVTRPVQLQVALTRLDKEANGQVERFQARAGTTISRSEFGMGELTQLVADKVDLCMNVEAVRYHNQPGGITDPAELAGSGTPVTAQR